MKQMGRLFRPYGLKARFAVSILVSGLICAAVFCALFIAKDRLIEKWIEDPAVEARLNQKKVDDLREFISENDIASTDLSKLENWEKRQPLILMELYDGGEQIYSSYYAISETGGIWEEGRVKPAGGNNVYDVRFADKTLSAVIYTDISYKYYILGNAIALTVALLLFVMLYLRFNRGLIRYVCKLGEDVQILEGGNLEYEVTVEGNDELADLARSMNRMRGSFRDQMIKEQELHQANSKLVSEMSHDIRTPLTGLMLYIEILRSGNVEDREKIMEYLDKIEGKAKTIKDLSDNLFEYSLKNRERSESEIDSFESAVLPVAEMIKKEIEEDGFVVTDDIRWKPVMIVIKKDLTGRIAGNIISNIKKYADKEEPVYVETVYQEGKCGLSFINAYDAEKIKTDSHKIGLESVSSMMAKMGGCCLTEQTADAFCVTLMFNEVAISNNC